MKFCCVSEVSIVLASTCYKTLVSLFLRFSAGIYEAVRRGISAQNQVITGPGVGSGKLFDPGIVHFGGKVPQLPQVFEQDMATSAFTHRHDAPEVVRLQRKVFHEKVTTSKEVRLQWLPYEELDRLIEALPHFQVQNKHLGA